MGKHAIVFGASGITGWAVVNELLSNSPQSNLFDKVTALTNRPLLTASSVWPQTNKLQIVSEIDILRGTQADLENLLREAIPDVHTITQLFYNAYKWSKDAEEESSNNVLMLDRSVRAIMNLSPSLEYVVLPTGTKAYGIHLIDRFPYSHSLPLSEKLPRLPEPYASQLFYHRQIDRLRVLAEGNQWTWCEVRPDIVVGFVPNNNAHCLQQTLAIYLSLFASCDPGGKVPFPGTVKAWTIKSNDSSQGIIARFSIYASLHANRTGNGQAFNVADRSIPSTWSKKWPIICSFFGLEGVEPDESFPWPESYISEHRNEWNELTKKHDLKSGVVDNTVANPEILKFILTKFDFDRQLSLEAMRAVGFDEECDEIEAWFTAFKYFRRAKVIP